MIYFDLDNTLIDYNSSERKAIEFIFKEKYGLVLNNNQTDYWSKISRKYFDYYLSKQITFEEQGKNRFIKMLSNLRLPEQENSVELLAEVKAADYLPFIEQGEHAAYFGGDLLNVIGRRAVMARKDYKAKEDREAVAGYCAKMLQEYRSRRNREAELLVLLDSLAQSSDEMVGETNRFVWEASSEERERKELDKRGYGDYCRLLDRFGDLPLAAEVYLQLQNRRKSFGILRK